MTAASVFGTASTGTAIGTLSGAALNSASMAWIGGGMFGAGSVAAGTAVMWTGVGVFAVAGTAAIMYSFDAWDSKQQTKRIRLTIDRLAKTYGIDQ